MKIPKFLLNDSIFINISRQRYFPSVINYSLFLQKISAKSLLLLLFRKIIVKFFSKSNRYPIELAGLAGGIKIFHRIDLNGEGYNLFYDYVRAYNSAIKRPVDTILEVGCGPSYLGFLFLGLGFCKKLILSDINQNVMKVVEKTIKENNLENEVKFYLGDTLSNVPDNCCDLIISNPVMFDEEIEKKEWRINTTTRLIATDKDWSFQKKLYKEAPRVLKKNGHVLLQNNYFGGDNKLLFSEFAKESGGKVEKIVEENPLTPETPLYYISVIY